MAAFETDDVSNKIFSGAPIVSGPAPACNSTALRSCGNQVARVSRGWPGQFRPWRSIKRLEVHNLHPSLPPSIHPMMFSRKYLAAVGAILAVMANGSPVEVAERELQEVSSLYVLPPWLSAAAFRRNPESRAYIPVPRSVPSETSTFVLTTSGCHPVNSSGSTATCATMFPMTSTIKSTRLVLTKGSVAYSTSPSTFQLPWWGYSPDGFCSQELRLQRELRLCRLPW